MGIFRKSYFERLKDMAEVNRKVLTYAVEYLSDVLEINSKNEGHDQTLQNSNNKLLKLSGKIADKLTIEENIQFGLITKELSDLYSNYSKSHSKTISLSKNMVTNLKEDQAKHEDICRFWYK